MLISFFGRRRQLVIWLHSNDIKAHKRVVTKHILSLAADLFLAICVAKTSRPNLTFSHRSQMALSTSGACLFLIPNLRGRVVIDEASMVSSDHEGWKRNGCCCYEEYFDFVKIEIASEYVSVCEI